jgi:predicted membrane protein
MIKMAEFDKHDGKSCTPMIQYARKDYVSMNLLKSFVAGTITFGVILGLWALYTMEELLHTINSMDLQAFVISILMKYIVFLVIYMALTYIAANQKYSSGRRKVKQYYNSLKKTEQMYERDERLKLPEDRDWE